MKKALLYLAVALSLVSAASFGARYFWLLELTSHFRPHLAAGAVLLFLCGVSLRSRAGTILAFVAFVVNAIPLWPYVDFSAYAAPHSPAGLQRHRLLHFNLEHRFADLAGLKDLIVRERPDMVLLTEVPAAAGAMIADLRALYPHVGGEAGGSLFDVVLLSRFPFAQLNVDRTAGAKYPVTAADLCLEGPKGCLRVVALHAAAPLLPAWADIRNQQLILAAKYARDAESGHALLVGDLNLTPWSPYFAQLKKQGQLGDSGMGRGLVGTWESPIPFVGLTIDHVLTGPRVIALDRRLGEDLESDHFPVIVDFALQ